MFAVMHRKHETGSLYWSDNIVYLAGSDSFYVWKDFVSLDDAMAEYDNLRVWV
jgi:hypothetical protein